MWGLRIVWVAVDSKCVCVCVCVCVSLWRPVRHMHALFHTYAWVMLYVTMCVRCASVKYIESCHIYECVSLHVSLQIRHARAFTRTDTLQHTAATCCNMLQHAATCGSKLQHAATLQHAAQLARKLCETARISVIHTFQWMASLQHAATCCNMLQHTQ